MPSGLSRLIKYWFPADRGATPPAWMRPDEHGSADWRSLPLRLAIVALPLWFTVTVLIFNVAWPIKLVIGVVFGVTLAAPAEGLLLAAVLAPLGQLIAGLVGPISFRIGEAIVVAFLVGWVLRGDPDRPGPRVPAPIVGALLALTIIASIAGLAWQLNQLRGALAGTANALFRSYYLIADRIGFIEGARLIEGLALVAATVTLFRQRPALSVKLPVVLAASLCLWLGIGSAAALERYSRIGYRVSGHVADVNAAGSYFAMILCLALGMALRERGRARALWSAAAVANIVGLWFAESRSAMAAAAIVLAVAAAWALSARWKPPVRAIALFCLIVVAVGLGTVRARQLGNDPTYRGTGFRQQFNATSLRMIQARPVFGFGVGQYYALSPLFLTPELAWHYGHENAHNYFLQVGAELGLLGLGLFGVWLGVAAIRAARALVVEPHDWRLLGAAAGVIAFLGTSLTGHPLLVDEVTYPFWLQFGLVAGLAGSVLLNAEPAAHGFRPRTPRAWLWAGAVLAGGIVVLAPISAARGTVEPPASQSVDGFFGWETGSDGAPFRWTGRYASLLVPADVRHVYVQVRVPTSTPAVAPMGVEVMIAGHDGGRTLVGESWATLSLALPAVDRRARFKRIDLKIDRTWQPALYLAGSADMRTVGVQVGAPQLVRSGPSKK